MTTHTLPPGLPMSDRVDIAQRLVDLGGITTPDEYLAVLSQGVVSDEVLKRASTPAGACWLCDHFLGTDTQCLMCDAYRKDTAPVPTTKLPDFVCAKCRAPWVAGGVVCGCGYPFATDANGPVVTYARPTLHERREQIRLAAALQLPEPKLENP